MRRWMNELFEYVPFLDLQLIDRNLEFVVNVVEDNHRDVGKLLRMNEWSMK